MKHHLDLRAVPTHLLYEAATAANELCGFGPAVRAAENLGFETDLTELLATEWESRIDDALKEALRILLFNGDATMTPEVLDQALAAAGDVFGTDFVDEVKSGVSSIISDAYTSGREHVLKPLKIGFTEQLVDEKAQAQIEKDSLYWIGSYWDRDVGQSISVAVNDLVIQKGLSRLDAGAVLQSMLGSDFPEKSESYWNLVASAGVQRATVFGAIGSFKQTRVKTVRFFNPNDFKTSDLCAHLNGMVFPVSHAYSVMDNFLAATTPEEAKEAHPWPSSEEVKEMLQIHDPKVLAANYNVVPQLHGFCRSELIPHEFEGEGEEQKDEDQASGAEGGEERACDRSHIQVPRNWVQRQKEAGRVALIVAFNPEGELLLGKRNDNGEWTLPGGHLLSGEDPLEGGRRELAEETALNGSDVHPLFEPAGADVWLYVFTAVVDGVPTGKYDPDGECDEWKFFDVSKGLPADVLSNLHGPADPDLNVVKKLFGGISLEARVALEGRSLPATPRDG